MIHRCQVCKRREAAWWYVFETPPIIVYHFFCDSCRAISDDLLSARGGTRAWEIVVRASTQHPIEMDTQVSLGVLYKRA